MYVIIRVQWYESYESSTRLHLKRFVDNSTAKACQGSVTVHETIKVIDAVWKGTHESEGEVGLDEVCALHIVDDCCVEFPNLAFAALLPIVLIGSVVVLS